MSQQAFRELFAPVTSFVHPPGSAHHCAVAGGRAPVLYLLPEGRTEFTSR